MPDFRRFFPPVGTNFRGFLVWFIVVAVAGTVIYVFDIGKRPRTPRGDALDPAYVAEREADIAARRAREAEKRKEAEARSAEARRRLREKQRAEDEKGAEDWVPASAQSPTPTSPSSGGR